MKDIDLSARTSFGAVLVGAMFGSIITAALVSIGIIPISRAEIVDQKMQYADAITIMLASVGLLVTVLGVLVAILALWGIKHVREQARDAAVTYVKKGLTDGELRRIVESRIDAITLKNPQARTQEETRQGRSDQKWGDPSTEYGDV